MSAAAETARAATALLEGGAVMLGAALLFVILFRRLGLGATLGYIVGGVVIGPHGLGLFNDPAQLASFTELGIALLLFIVGLELNPARLWRMRKDIFGLGLAQVLLCGLALALFLHFALDISVEAALAIGLPLGLSSTAQVLPMLRSSGDLNSRYGERAFSILLFQDLSIVPMITLVAAMSRVPGGAGKSGLLLAGTTVAAIIALVLVGRLLLNPLFKLVGRLGERELFVTAGLFTVVAAAALMHSLGLSVALGAFVAGVMLAESPYRHELESDVEPFRSILLGLFFLTVGMLLDLHLILARPLLVLGLAAAVIAIKGIIISLLARLFGKSWWLSVKLSLLLSQAGEFGFVLFAQAAAAALILPEAASLFGAVVTLSMVTTPFLMRVIDWLEAHYETPRARPAGPDGTAEGSVIVVGYGRFGQTVAQMLMAKRVPLTLIDLKPQQIELADEFGTKVFYGDGTRIDLLRIAGAEQARAILFCNDGEALTREAVQRVLEAFPHASVMARVFDRRQLIALDGLDLAHAQRELFESAVTMGRAALKVAGVEAQEVDRVESEYRLRDCERLERQAVAGDLHAGADRMFAADRALGDDREEDTVG